MPEEQIIVESAPIVLSEEAADAWAAVLIDLYEKRKRREAEQRRAAGKPDEQGDHEHAAGGLRSGR